MQIIILAAGLGSRLGKGLPKALVPVTMAKRNIKREKKV